VGLLHGSAVFWLVALGPVLLLFLIRAFMALMRPPPGTRADANDAD
jgi:hypothetical protein